MSSAEMQADVAEIGSDNTAVSTLTSWATTPRDPFVATGVTPFNGGSTVSTASYGPGMQYESPPSIATGADLGQVIQHMSPAQASWLGWGMAQMAQQKQVSVPPQDAQTWSALAGYELKHNPYFTGAAPVQMSKGQLVNTGGSANEFSVASEFVTASPVDIGKGVEAIIGGFTDVLGLALGGVGDVADAAALGDAAADAADASAAAADASTAADDAAGATAQTGAAGEASAHFGDTAYLNDAAAEPDLSSDMPADATWKENSNPLYSNGEPMWGDANQGATGNCGPCSAVQELAMRNPSAIADRIRANGDGTYSVACGPKKQSGLGVSR